MITKMGNLRLLFRKVLLVLLRIKTYEQCIDCIQQVMDLESPGECLKRIPIPCELYQAQIFVPKEFY